jgi:hypothetical protein
MIATARMARSGSWTRHFVTRAPRTRTTWRFRLAALGILVLSLWVARGWWTVALARSLVCEPSGAPSDAILVENFDQEFLVFERASTLRRTGLAPRVLVPVWLDRDGVRLNDVAAGTAEVMARIARLGPVDMVPIREAEPISLNAARDVLSFARREGIRSVLVVSPEFRSRRSALVYGATLGRAGITVRCEPARGPAGVDDWTHTWHGIQDVAQQWGKLQYYRIYVLPFGGGRRTS